MRFSTLAMALTSATLGSARIIGFSAPSVLAPNTTFPLTLFTENYIQSVSDVAVSWGFEFNEGFPGATGRLTTSEPLGADKSNTLSNITIDAMVPAGLAQDIFQDKDLILTAAVYSIYGASGSPTVTGYNVTVRVGEQTGGEVKTSSKGWRLDAEGLKTVAEVEA
jgi:hypothetical protein